jgi:hypothetical protein
MSSPILRPDEPADLVTLELKIDFSLVPEWSNMVERMAKHFGEEVTARAQPDHLLLVVKLRPEQKAPFQQEMKLWYTRYAAREQRLGRWSPR